VIALSLREKMTAKPQEHACAAFKNDRKALFHFVLALLMFSFVNSMDDYNPLFVSQICFHQ
jgi:hypothetical protein